MLQNPLPPASGFVSRSFQPFVNSLWPMPTSDSDNFNLEDPFNTSLYFDWSFISPPPIYDFSAMSRSLSLAQNQQLCLNFSLPSTPPISSRPKPDPGKIYSPKPVFGYNTVHFDLVRSFSPDEPERTLSPKPSSISVVSRKRPREVDVNTDVNDAIFAKKRLKPANHISKVKRASSSPSRPLVLSTRQLGVIRNP